MKSYFLRCALAIALSTPAAASFAQDNTTQETAKEISIGSHVLKQKGDNEYAYKNEEYYYEKIWEAPGVSKDELYKRVRTWLRDLPDAELSKTSFDEEQKNSIGVTIALHLNEKNNIHNQQAIFRWQFSFKEGKIRLQGSNYRYYGDYDYGTKSRQIATPYGFRTELYTDAGAYDKQLHDLKPLTKGMMRAIYEQFDAEYLKLVRSMKKSVLTGADNNW